MRTHTESPVDMTDDISAPGDDTLYETRQHLNTDFLVNCSSPLNVYDHRRNKVVYVNNKFIQLTNLTEDECYDLRLESLEQWVHPSDSAILREKVMQSLSSSCADLLTRGNRKLSFQVNFRIRNYSENRETCTVLAQCSVLEWDENDTPATTLTLFSDITRHCSGQKIVLSVNVFDESENKWKTYSTMQFHHEPLMLSRREREIVSHIISDASATQISQRLNMPYYTVRAHWRNILLKTECKSQKELKERAHREGWI